MFLAVPPGTTNGEPIGTPPASVRGVRFYLPASASVSYVVGITQPESVLTPNATTPVNTTNATIFDEFLMPGENLYITAISGAPFYRWMGEGATNFSG
jgi:hypothetical protein